MPDDFYADNAEWYAALVSSWQEETNAALRALLGSLDGGDAIDLGSGVGLCLPLLRSLGAERLFAVEPSRSMRAGLMTTIARDSDLMKRTTVIPASLPQALDLLSERWSVVVMLNAIGHLDDDSRVRLWKALGNRLAPGARFVVSMQPPETVTTIPWTDFGIVQVGQHQLRTRGRAKPLNHSRVEWTMEWTLQDAAGDILETRSATHPWRALSRGDLAAEAAACDLTIVDAATDGHIFAFAQRRGLDDRARPVVSQRRKT